MKLQQQRFEPLPLPVTEYQQSIVTEIKKKLPIGAHLLHCTIVGSRGKGINTPNSDYDIKVLILRSKRDYLLQKAKAALRFDAVVKGIELEGTIIDCLRLSKYIQESNMSAHELFAGIPIYTTQTARKLETVWYETCDCNKLAVQYRGMLNCYIKKVDVKGGAKFTQNKVACEMVYISLKLLFLSVHQRLPPFDAKTLIDQTKELCGGYSWIREVFEERISNKDGDFCIFPSFCELIEKATNAQEKGQQDQSKKELVQERLENLFLDLMI